MSRWLSPNMATLTEVVSTPRGHLLLCSPYVSSPALHIVEGSLPKTVHSLEFWTKLDARDWLTGASDPEGLLDFLDTVKRSSRTVTIRHTDNLHAKMIVSNGAKAMAGSANLTAGGYWRNIEVTRVVTGQEVERLREVVNGMRPNLHRITYKQFADFVSECTARIRSREALIDLIREEAPAAPTDSSSLVTYRAFLDYLESQSEALAIDILRIATNLDHNNNTGKVKQAFYGVQRFLQEYPGHQSAVEGLPLEWFDVLDSSFAGDWIQFLDDFANEVNADYQYSLPTLRNYLPEHYGGTLTGGGGGGNELKRVWPYVGRALREIGS